MSQMAIINSLMEEKFVLRREVERLTAENGGEMKTRDIGDIVSTFCGELDVARKEVERLTAENADLRGLCVKVMPDEDRDAVVDERLRVQRELKRYWADFERLTALRVEMFNAIVEYGAGDDLLYHVLKAIMDAWFAGWAP